MKKKIILAASVAATGLFTIPVALTAVSCSEESTGTDTNTSDKKQQLRVATFNVSFATDNDKTETYDRWLKYMSVKPVDQEKYINAWLPHGNFIGSIKQAVVDKGVPNDKIREVTYKKDGNNVIIHIGINDGTKLDAFKNIPWIKVTEGNRKTAIDATLPLQQDTNVKTFAEENTPTAPVIKSLPSITAEDLEYGERIMQLRNTTAIIQHQQPDVLLFNEFNNMGDKEDTKILEEYSKNYLEVAQSLKGGDSKEEMQKPIDYFQYKRAYKTNTGLQSGFDLDNDGVCDGKDPDDAYGFGYYHGHYQFALMSKYEIDDANTRTFQNFLWKDFGGKDQFKSPKTLTFDQAKKDGARPIKQPHDAVSKKDVMPGEDWYNAEEWNKFRLSSKNHCDVPVKVNGETIHLLISHPVPPAFETNAHSNVLRNQYETQFWLEYVKSEGNDWIYDDKGGKGGIGDSKAKYIFMGDLNCDPYLRNKGEDANKGVAAFTNAEISPFSQEFFKDGKLAPKSTGAAGEPVKYDHKYPDQRTAVFGRRVDYVLPSKNIDVTSSGCYWKTRDEDGGKLFYDNRLGKFGDSKEVSSDHRMVWIDINL